MQVTAWQHDQDEHKTVLGPGAYDAVTYWFKIKYFALITAAVDKDRQLPA